MAIQDDGRENELRELFKLEKEGGRGDVDAVLTIDGKKIEFELKSTTKSSVSTVRDLGPDHIQKWRTMHWVVGVYNPAGSKLLDCYYASPAQMKTWVDEIAGYIAPDFMLAAVVPDLIGPPEMEAILGKKPRYSLVDAQRLQKAQHKKADYFRMMDLMDGYSPKRMLAILQARCKYIIERGSTLNNPHIPLAHFKGCDQILSNHAARLRELVRQYLIRTPKG